MIFLCVLKSGGAYTAAHVERLRWQVGKPVLCLTDDANVVFPTLPLELNLPGWWSKLELFRHDLGRVCYLDLDVTVQRLDFIEKVSQEGLWGMRDAYSPNGCHLNSSVMIWTGSRPHLVEGFAMGNVHLYPGGDQQWIAEHEPDLHFIHPPDIVSFKKHGKPANAGIIVYHGKPKPWDL